MQKDVLWKKSGVPSTKNHQESAKLHKEADEICHGQISAGNSGKLAELFRPGLLADIGQGRYKPTSSRSTSVFYI